MRAVIAQCSAVAVFELRQLVRARSTALGVASFFLLLALGHWAYWSARPPRPMDDRLFGYAYIAAMAFSLRLGLAADRERALDEYLVTNFVAPACYIGGKLLAAAAYLAAFGACAFAAALLLSAGEWTYALWYTLLFSLVAWVFLPAILLIELATDTRAPAAAAFVGFVVALVAVRQLYGAPVLVDALGLRVERFAFDTLAPLAARALAVPGILALLYPLCRWRLLGAAGWRHGRI